MARSGFSDNAYYLADNSPFSGGVFFPSTICAWCKLANAGVQYAVVLGGTESRRAGLGVTNGNTRAVSVSGSSVGTAESSAPYPRDRWFFATATFGSLSHRAAFLNGGNKGENTTSRNMQDMAPEIAVGRTISGFSWEGSLAHIGIWNRVLSDAEIRTLYNNGVGCDYRLVHPGDLVAYWPLGSNLRDIAKPVRNRKLYIPEAEPVHTPEVIRPWIPPHLQTPARPVVTSAVVTPTLQVDSAIQNQVAQEAALTPIGPFELEADDAIQLQVATEPTLSPVTVGDVNPDDAIQPQVATQPLLTHVIPLSVSSAVQPQLATQPLLVPEGELGVNHAVQLQVASQVTFSQLHELAVDSALQLQVASQPTLTPVISGAVSRWIPLTGSDNMRIPLIGD